MDESNRLLSDHQLVEATRDGSDEAWSALVARHRAPVDAVARERWGRSGSRRTDEAFAELRSAILADQWEQQDLASDYEIRAIRPRVLASMTGGTYGPVPPGADRADQGEPAPDPMLVTLAAAFGRLSPVWQTVLWHRLVDGEPSAAITAVIGRTATDVVAVEAAAERGLFESHLAVELEGPVEPACRPIVGLLAAYSGNTLAAAQRRVVDTHLGERAAVPSSGSDPIGSSGCAACRERLALGDRLREFVAPAIVPGLTALAPGRYRRVVGAGAALGSTALAAHRSERANRRALIGAVAAVIAALLIAGLVIRSPFGDLDGEIADLLDQANPTTTVPDGPPGTDGPPDPDALPSRIELVFPGAPQGIAYVPGGPATSVGLTLSSPAPVYRNGTGTIDAALTNESDGQRRIDFVVRTSPGVAFDELVEGAGTCAAEGTGAQCTFELGAGQSTVLSIRFALDATVSARLVVVPSISAQILDLPIETVPGLVLGLAGRGELAIVGNGFGACPTGDCDGRTANASSGDLVFPAGVDIDVAVLVWTGTDVGDAWSSSVSLTVPGDDTALVVEAERVDGATPFRSIADVTDLVRAAGAGTYTVERSDTGDEEGAWTLVVATRTSDAPRRLMVAVDPGPPARVGDPVAIDVPVTSPAAGPVLAEERPVVARVAVQQPPDGSGVDLDVALNAEETGPPAPRRRVCWHHRRPRRFPHRQRVSRAEPGCLRDRLQHRHRHVSGSVFTGRAERLAEVDARVDGYGRTYCRVLAELTDEWVIDLFEAAVRDHRPAGRVALLAIGGYGRGELTPGSDLDLLLVHDTKARKVAKEIEPTASALWYPLWDSGVKLGHAVRRIDEQLDLAGTDLDSATALITARTLAGDDSLADEVVEKGHALWRSKGATFLAELRDRVRSRQDAAGDVAYRLEPDLKDGHGGLRDVQSLWWAQEAGLDLRAEDLVDLDHCYDVLLRARVALHLSTERPGDVLRLEDQDGAAATGGWDDADHMMTDVAAAGRTVAWLCDENWGRVRSAPDIPAQPIAPGVVLRDGEVELTATADPASDSTLVLQTAVAAARHGARIGRSTLDRLHDEAPGWTGAWPVGATDDLVALLLEGHRAVPVLESLDQRNLVARLLPEWEPVRSKPQRNAYHRFTVDRHLWEAAANAAALVDRVTRPDLLVLGALFHDLGKGYPGDHTEVGMELIRTVGPKLGLAAPDVDVIVTLIEQHLLLPDVAMRRDLTDPATIEQVASAVETVEVLDLLHALTEADSLATGPSAWGDWKEGLVSELVARVRHVLGGGDVAEVTWRLFPDADTLEVMARGELDISRRGDVITVVSHDAAGMFSRIAGVLSLHGLDVISAQAHSAQSGVAASQFRILIPESGLNWRSVKADLGRALAFQLAIEARLAERAKTYRRRRRTQAAPPPAPTVVFDDAASSNATVIVVCAPDKVGILHRISKAIGELGLDIRHATVQTIGMEVVDTFYVRAGDALVTDTAHRKEIKRALLHAVS